MKTCLSVPLAVASFAGFLLSANAQSTIDLGSASNFAVLAGASVVNTGSTIVNGNLGVNPGTTISGFPPGLVVGGASYVGGIAVQAESDLATAYNNGAAISPTVFPAYSDLGGHTLAPGIYNFSSAVTLTGTLTLSGAGAYVFQVGSTLTTTSNNSLISLTGGAQAADVFWLVGTSATLGTSSDFAGTILAQDSITADTGATSDGGLLSETGTVTLDTNNVSAVPEPANEALLVAGLAALVIGVQRLRQGRARPVAT